VGFAAGQWALLSLVAKIGGGEMLGQYALAVAVATPVAMLFHLNLRATLATDSGGLHPFGDYLAVRLTTAAAGAVAIAAVAALSGYAYPESAAILLAGFAQLIENVSDIFYGALQRRERMDKIARSMIARAALAAVGLAMALWLTHNLLAAMSAMVIARLLVLLFYDRRVGTAGERLERTGRKTEWHLLRTALPLGFVLMLISLNNNVPRYAIERYLGVRELGAFAAVAAFVGIGTTAVGALGHSAMPRLARYYAERNRAAFKKLAAGVLGMAFLIGVAGVVTAWVIGGFALRLVYRPEFAAYKGLLVEVMAVAVLGYIAIALGYVITSVRAFDPQLPLFVVVALASAAASWILVPRLGVHGAPVALAIAAAVQVAGELAILARRLRHLEAA
jgi:O-antigen/teichoic acid export membrane protein